MGERFIIKVEEVAELKLKIIALEEALQFYQYEAEGISKNFNKNTDALMASMAVLNLDAGRRAKKTLSDE